MGGVAQIPLPTFIWAIALGRGVRYFGEGILAVMYGKQALDYIHENGRSSDWCWVLPCSRGASCITSGSVAGAANDVNACIIATSMNPELSLVIPIRNESPNIDALYAKSTEALERWGRSYEVIAVDDGSTDDSFERLARCQQRDPRWRIIRFRQQLRPDRRICRRLPPRARTADRDVRRRSAERPARLLRHDPAHRGRQRHRVRLAQGPQRHVADAPPPVRDRQQADLVVDRRQAA